MTTSVAALALLPALPNLSRPQDEDTWSRYKDQFLFPQGVTYLNCGILGEAPRLANNLRRQLYGPCYHPFLLPPIHPGL